MRYSKTGIFLLHFKEETKMQKTNEIQNGGVDGNRY